MAIKLIPGPNVPEYTGESRSSRYVKIGKGTFPPPVKIGPRSVGWPDYEIDAINSARIAGKSDDEIRALVIALVAARRKMA